MRLRIMTFSSPKPSLNHMVLSVLGKCHKKDRMEYVTARQVRDLIERDYRIDYPIQTIIVVLNRFVSKGDVCRRSFAGKEVRQRYAYYIESHSALRREQHMMDRFQDYANEFFEGDVRTAISQTKCLIETVKLVKVGSS